MTGKVSLKEIQRKSIKKPLDSEEMKPLLINGEEESKEEFFGNQRNSGDAGADFLSTDRVNVRALSGARKGTIRNPLKSANQ
jgi:hypothetical protein